MNVRLNGGFRRKYNTVYAAARKNDIDGVKRLLAAGRPVDEPDANYYNQTALHYAARHGYTAIAEVLINAKANVNAADSLWKLTPLHLVGANASVAELLLNNGADISAVDDRKDTPLHSAARNGHTLTVKTLLDKGANVNAVNTNGNTPLHSASRNGHILTVETLINKRANVNAVNAAQRAPLHCAAWYGKIPIVDLLLNNGANPNIVEDIGNTPLMRACYGNSLDVVKLLLSKSADVSHRNKKQENALFAIIDVYSPFLTTSQDKCNALNIMTILLDNNIDMITPNKDGKTPIEYVRSKIGTESDLMDEYFKGAEILLMKVKAARVYKELKTEPGIPIDTSKLLLCGDGGAGKTTLKNSLLKTSESKAGPAPGEDKYVLTPGIDISKEELPGVGKMVILDMAGQESYFCSHAMFLHANKATIIAMYQVCDFVSGKVTRPLDILEREMNRIINWFQMLKVRNPSCLSGVKLTVILVASRGDWAEQFNYQSEAIKMAQTIKEEVIKIFGHYINVIDKVLVLNAHDYDSSSMDALRLLLKNRKEQVIEISEPMPAICAKILHMKEKWIEERKLFPVMYWTDFVINVKQDINSSIEEDFLRKATEYLYDYGEILFIRSTKSNMEDVIILDSQWFCHRIIGPLMATDLFVQYTKKLKKQTVYTFDDIKDVLVKEANMDLLINLLSQFEIIVPLGEDDYGGGHEGKYIIPNLLSVDMPQDQWKKEHETNFYFGRRFQCKSFADMFSPNFFPQLQARLHDLYTKLKRPPSGIWKNGIKVSDIVEALVFLSADKRAVNIAVRCERRNQHGECYSLMKKVTITIRQVLHATSPGADVEFHILSAYSLRNHHDLNKVVSYPIEQILQAEDMKTTMYNENIGIEEEVSDLLVPGFDLTILKEYGIQCDVKWMKHQARRKLVNQLELEIPNGRDHRLLAEYMGIDDSGRRTMAARAYRLDRDVTDQLLDKWSENWTARKRNNPTTRSTHGKVYYESSIKNLLEINNMYLENDIVKSTIEDMIEYPEGKPL
ncbi:death-associated protein kinase 1-like [Saccoglossus kowalevskii]|uniref:Death-associated protein kinase 1-like n=1 Tax=Saccoglossus kowalevskii TaxID=10224 RepID=A0ABM0M515_SACKO|nr:PREDICTED: death-associated protein kinase 1-like [Saccoglossus kowalevskii]